MDNQVSKPAREQSRARHPDAEGWVESDGVRVYYEVYGTGDSTILFLPPWEIVHSRAWKFQIPYFARHSRVVTFDRRGNGRSDRPVDVRAYNRRATAHDALAVLDKVGAGQVTLVSWCCAGDDLILAAEHPDRITGLVMIAPDLLLTDDPSEEEGSCLFDEEPVTPEGWAKWNRAATTGSVTGQDFWSSSSRRRSPSRIRPSPRRTRSGGTVKPTPRPSSGEWTPNGLTTGRPRCGSAPRSAARRWSSRGRTTRSLDQGAGPPWQRRSRTRSL